MARDYQASDIDHHENLEDRTYPVIPADPRVRLGEFSPEKRRVIENQTTEYVKAAQSAALEAVLDRFEKNCCQKTGPSHAELQSVIEALLHLGMVFNQASNLLHEIMEKHDCLPDTTIICGRLIHEN